VTVWSGGGRDCIADSWAKSSDICLDEGRRPRFQSRRRHTTRRARKRARRVAALRENELALQHGPELLAPIMTNALHATPFA
jgi:hypothetical protein